MRDPDLLRLGQNDSDLGTLPSPVPLVPCEKTGYPGYLLKRNRKRNRKRAGNQIHDTRDGNEYL
ncbi:hypothetical protein BELL_0270g00110 [Botrytis elliptica]|uniref:Uncharacterized protein n=1 Tax=Botrytis elliptica TaxID=278938 RepID=A0A4Z1K052_9HELO|nr:hypothetical protein BELL_0270g00110 [Botrytis elliptica]